MAVEDRFETIRAASVVPRHRVETAMSEVAVVVVATTVRTIATVGLPRAPGHRLRAVLQPPVTAGTRTRTWPLRLDSTSCDNASPSWTMLSLSWVVVAPVAAVVVVGMLFLPLTRDTIDKGGERVYLSPHCARVWCIVNLRVS